MRFQSFVKPIIGISIFGVLSYLVLEPPFSHALNSARRSSCQSNLKSISAALVSYTRDFDGEFPPISSGEKGWADLLPQSEGFQCPAGVKTNGAHSDYFYNARVAGIEWSHLVAPEQTLVFGEGIDSGGSNSHLLELPLNWKIDENSPAKRHLSGSNYAFADGHVKFLWPKAVSTQSPTKNSHNWKSTFAVR